MSHSNYIVHSQKGHLFSFYYMTGSIYMRSFSNNQWSRAENLVSDIRQNYSVSQYKGVIYLICQEIKGNILLYSCSDNIWTRKVLLEGKEKSSPDIYMKPIISNKGLQLIYNLPDSQSKIQSLITHCQLSDGRWEQPQKIDTLTPNQSFFKLINQKYLLYTKGNSLYCKSLEQNTIKKLFSGNITDYSAICIDNKLHLSIITKARTGIQLLYLTEERARILWEGNIANFTGISLIKGQINILWTAGNKLFSITNPYDSRDISKCGSDNYIKAEYIPCDKEKINFNDIILNSTRPNDLYFVESPKNNDMDEKINKLQARLNNMTQEISKKDSAINQLYGFKTRNQELQQENSSLRQRYKELLEKYKTMENSQKNTEKQLPVVVEDVD